MVTGGYLVRNFNMNTIRINKREFHLLLEKQITSIQEYAPDTSGYYCCFGDHFLEQVYLKNDLLNDLTYINSFMHQYPLRLSGTVYERLRNIFSVLLTLYQYPEENIRLLHTYLVTAVCEVKQLMNRLDLNPYPSKAFFIAGRYNDLLIEHITENRDIDYYASRLGVSPNHLNKCVRIATGKTAVTVRNEMTLLEAKLQLRQNEKSISDIAFDLGFSEPSYFTRFFKKYTGDTPFEYRKLEK